MNKAHYRTVTKYAATPLTADEIPYRLRQAFQALRSGRPQPAMVDIPDEAASDRLSGPLDYKPVPWVRSAADFGAVREAADLLLRAKLPLIWAGNGVLYAEATDELQQVAELLGAPMMNTLQGKSAFDETPRAGGGTGGHAKTAGAVVHCLAGVGRRAGRGLVSLSQSTFTPAIPPGKMLIHATNDPRDLNKVHQTDVPILADAKLFLQPARSTSCAGVSARRSGRGGARSPRRSRALRAGVARRVRVGVRGRRDADQRLPDVPRAVERARPGHHDDLRTNRARHATSSACSTSRRRRAPISAGATRRSSASRSGLSSARSSRTPSKTVVNVMGDGAIGMTGMDLETASRENIPILTVIKHDSIFSGYPANYPESRTSATTRSSRAATTRRSPGRSGWYVGAAWSSPAELRAVFQRALAAIRDGQPALVDVITKETTRLSTFGSH